jgi:DNA-binding CsgD family transcriptional regulator
MAVPDLSLTEERIVLLLAAGKSMREIATALALDQRTVSWHVARAARKLVQLSTLHRRLTQQTLNSC